MEKSGTQSRERKKRRKTEEEIVGKMEKERMKEKFKGKNERRESEQRKYIRERDL